jgi:hypothetical protein
MVLGVEFLAQRLEVLDDAGVDDGDARSRARWLRSACRA